MRDPTGSHLSYHAPHPSSPLGLLSGFTPLSHREITPTLVVEMSFENLVPLVLGLWLSIWAALIWLTLDILKQPFSTRKTFDEYFYLDRDDKRTTLIGKFSVPGNVSRSNRPPSYRVFPPP